MERTAEQYDLLQELEEELCLYDGQGRPANCDAIDCWWHQRHGQEGAVELCYWFLLKAALPGYRSCVADCCAIYRQCEGCGVCRRAGTASGWETRPTNDERRHAL